jgi:hypothetical protein
MSLLIFLSIPALCGIAAMAVAFTRQVLYPRLKGRTARVIQFPLYIEPRPRRKRAA